MLQLNIIEQCCDFQTVSLLCLQTLGPLVLGVPRQTSSSPSAQLCSFGHSCEVPADQRHRI